MHAHFRSVCQLRLTVSCRLLVTRSVYSEAAVVIQVIADVIEAQKSAAAGLEVTPAATTPS